MTERSQAKLVCVIILNWNGAEDTLQCIESVEATDYSDFFVILVDNASDDNCAEKIRSRHWSMPVEIIQNESNLGYAAGNNVGIRRALETYAEFLFILNNDTVINSETIPRLVDAANKYPAAGVFGPCSFFMDKESTISSATSFWNGEKLNFDSPLEEQDVDLLFADDTETDYVCGAALFFRREVVDEVGLFDERFFLTWEETDWCFRARKAGFLNYVVPSSTILHKVAASFDSEESPLRAYFATRNRLLWVEKNCSWYDRWRLIARNLLHIFPRVRYESGSEVPILKQIYWTSLAYLDECKTRSSSPRHKAYRRAIRDYLLRNFGDCPQSIRKLNRSWISPE